MCARVFELLRRDSLQLDAHSARPLVALQSYQPGTLLQVGNYHDLARLKPLFAGLVQQLRGADQRGSKLRFRVARRDCF